MARQLRLSLTDHLHHVMLRGNNGQAVFVDDADRRLFVDILVTQVAAVGVELHAWALPNDAVHLLLTPRRDGALSLAMQALGRSYVQAFNRKHGRSGTLWEGRYRSTVLQPDPWLMRCMVWMDGLLIKTGQGAVQLEHLSSSAGHYLGLRVERVLTVPPQYWALGNTPFAREDAYRTLMERGLEPAVRQALADAALKGWPLGTDAFVASLQALTPRRLVKAKPGRPTRAQIVAT